MISEQFKAALFRAGGQAILAGLAIVATSIATEPDLGKIGRNAVAAILAGFVWRAGIEGWWDTSRNNAGDVTSADVGSGLR